MGMYKIQKLSSSSAYNHNTPYLERAVNHKFLYFKFMISIFDLPSNPNYMIFEAIENSWHCFRDI
jgi:hypothetical protein